MQEPESTISQQQAPAQPEPPAAPAPVEAAAVEPVAAAPAPVPAPPAPDITESTYYFNREVSWADFNDRVLQLAEDDERRCSSA